MSYRHFGRRPFVSRIFELYEKRPMLMNAVVGGGVYGSAEAIAELSNPNAKLDVKRIAPIAALGSLEVGGLMTVWYNMLDRFIGTSGASRIVLAKCAADQLFFATQGDGLFLALCASLDKEDLPHAIHEVKLNFLTTWLNDCAVWPLVNFIGFWRVPTTLIPTYMASMQLLWQLYLSMSQQKNAQVEASAPGAVPADFATVTSTQADQVFAEFDTDGSGEIDAGELRSALERLGIAASADDVKQMMKFADLDNNGQVDRAEFRKILERRSSGDGKGDNHQAVLWQTAIARTNQLTLQKGGIKGALVRVKQFEQDKISRQSATEPARDADSKLQTRDVSLWIEFTTPLRESVKDEGWRRDRADALRNSTLGLSILTCCVALRVLIFKH
jgi:hypothetical protein